MKKVLNILNSVGSGGAEAFALNVFRGIENDIQMDFLIRDENGNILENEINELGGSVIKSPKFPRHIIKNYFFMKNFFRDNINNYDSVHIHANALIYVLPIYLAKKYKYKRIILHSHNTQTIGKKAYFLHTLNRFFFNKSIDERIACSEKAGKWMFDKEEFEFIPNGIDVKKFKFDMNMRIDKRRELNIDNQIVIGHVGRFIEQKNHFYLIDIFSAYRKTVNSKLLLIGDGILKKDVENYVHKKGLGNDVIFLGSVTDIYKYYNVMDIFLLPSLYEGLPVSIIEAQSNGLPVFSSFEAVTDEAKLTEDFKLISNKKEPYFWASELKNIIIKEENERVDKNKMIQGTNFDLNNLEKRMLKIYR
ncbi:glycosyltransferase [Vagococcus fluvialis]|uniref:glycosyltransferase n=1 Tax=Vagococcus fluvialis TaxID=2738 RepID=UPI0037BC1CCB